MEQEKTYELAALEDIDIDAWVAGVDNLSDEPGVMEEACAMAGLKCPKGTALYHAEFEDALNFIATRDKYRFDSKGRIVSFDKFHK